MILPPPPPLCSAILESISPTLKCLRSKVYRNYRIKNSTYILPSFTLQTPNLKIMAECLRPTNKKPLYCNVINVKDCLETPTHSSLKILRNTGLSDCARTPSPSNLRSTKLKIFTLKKIEINHPNLPLTRFQFLLHTPPN